MTPPLVIIALIAGLGWYFSTKRGNPMRSDINGAIYCWGATAVLLGVAVYATVVTARSDQEGSGAGYAVPVLIIPFVIAFAAGGWIFTRRAKTTKHQRTDESSNAGISTDAA